jgi:hypothetical protein
MKLSCLFAALVLATSFAAQESSAQSVAIDPTARLKEVLPPDVLERVLARIADARARQLPAEALENRALKFAAKGVAPLDIERSLNEQAERMGTARSALAGARAVEPRADEIEAGAEAIRKGVDGAAVAELAKAAPKRSLAVPLFVIGSLTDRGLPSDEALQKVLDRLTANASDAEIERLPADVPARSGSGNAYGREKAQPNRGGSRKPQAGRPATTGKPAGVPGNGGARVNPGQGKKPPKS